MKRGRTDKDWAVVAAMTFGAGVVITWGMLSKHPPQPRPPVNIDWPAWVQAIGSVLAIVFAVLVPKWTRQAEATERQRREKAEAMALATVMVREMERFRWSVYMDLLRAEHASPEDTIEINLKAIPQALWSNALDLPRLGEPGNNALRAIYLIHRARDYAGGNKVVREDIRSYAIYLKRAMKHADNALTGLREMLD